MRTQWGILHAVIAVSVVVVASGCHLYDAGNDQLAQQMQKTFHELHIAASVDDERKASTEMLKAELDAATRFGNTMRDNRLAVLFDMLVAKAPGAKACPVKSDGLEGSLLCEIDIRLQYVAGDDAVKLNQALAVLPDAGTLSAEDFAKLHNYQLSDEEHKAIDFTCSDDNQSKIEHFDPRTSPAFATENGEVRRLLWQQLQAYAGPGGTCTQWLKSKKAVKKAGGLLAVAAETQARVGQALAQSQAAADGLNGKDGLKAKYDAAKKKYEDAKNKKTGVDEAKDELKKIEDTINQYAAQANTYSSQVATALSNAKVFGNPVQVAALQAKVDSLADAVQSIFGKAKQKYDKLGVGALVTAIDQQEAADEQKELPALILEYQVAAGQLAVAQAAIDAAHAESAALYDRVAALQRAVQELMTARRALKYAGCAETNDAATIAKVASATVADALGSSCGRGVGSAILHYANAFTIGINPARAAQLRYIGAIDSGALAQSAAVMQAWDNVLGVPIDLLAKYHAGGVKPEVIAQLIVQAAGFAMLTATTGVQASK